MTYPGGARYIGYWLENRKHGHGVFILGGVKITGYWSNGVSQGQVEATNEFGQIMFRGLIDELVDIDDSGSESDTAP